MKLTIIPIDNSVTKDGEKLSTPLDLSSISIPNDVHALQWDGSEGWIEYKSPLVQNEKINSLPSWANECVNIYLIEANKKLDNIQTIYTDAEKLALIKADRNFRLSASDWTQLPDVIALHDQAWVDAWRTYRQQLRDLPSTLTNYDDVFYPLPPNA